MPNEDDRFGDVAEQLKRTAGDEIPSDDESDRESETASTVDDAPEKADGESSSTEHEENTDETSTKRPAFAFDETDMRGFYVRQETWERVTRMRSSVTAACSTFDLPEFEGREFQDACLRAIAEHADEVALQILREREIGADEDRIREVVEMLNAQAGSN